jgi:hypothetical protein
MTRQEVKTENRLARLGVTLLVLAAAACCPLAASAQGDSIGSQIKMSRSVILDAQNHALIIKASPCNHRRIQALLAQITRDPDLGKNYKTRVFRLSTLSQKELFQLVKYNVPGFNPNTGRVLVVPESRNRPVVSNSLPGGYLLPAPGAASIGSLGSGTPSAQPGGH